MSGISIPGKFVAGKLIAGKFITGILETINDELVSHVWKLVASTRH